MASVPAMPVIPAPPLIAPIELMPPPALIAAMTLAGLTWVVSSMVSLSDLFIAGRSAITDFAVSGRPSSLEG